MFTFCPPCPGHDVSTGGDEFNRAPCTRYQRHGSRLLPKKPPCDLYTSGSHQEGTPSDATRQTQPLLPPACEETPESTHPHTGL